MRTPILCLLLLSGCASNVEPYAKIGAGYKFHEADMTFTRKGVSSPSHKVSARLEVGIEQGGFCYGVSHHSQYFSGWPANSNGEYYKTEVFIDYKFKFQL